MSSLPTIIADEQPPVITCPPDFEVTTEPGEDFAIVVFPQPTAVGQHGDV